MNKYALFSEQYKPTKMSECILEAFPEYIQKQFEYLEYSDSLPNILLFGIAGTGKSTIADILCDVKKYDVYKLEGSTLNKESIASLKCVISTSSLFSKPKAVFIDEADGITIPAQYALRSLIEPTYKVSWVFTCNFKKKLIEPIASRFMQIECALPAQGHRDKHKSGIVRRLIQILDAERIEGVSDEDLSQIVSLKYPDIRQTINEMQLRYGPLSRAA